MSKNINQPQTRRFFTDSLWSILALAIMNVITQFLLYPVLRNVLGVEEYGNALYVIGAINIMATACGSSVNLARLVASVKGKTYNIDSTVWLLGVQVIVLPICWGVLKMGALPSSPDQLLLMWILAGVTIWRYYADVDFRLSTNYKGYFVYYVAISIGYLLGIVLFRLTGLWYLILLPGEMAGLAYVWWKGSVLKPDGSFSRERFTPYLKSVCSLMVAQLLVNVVLNADRLVLKTMIDGEAVTLYYIASLVGKTMALISTPLNSVIIGHLAKSKAQLSSGNFLKLSGLGVALTGLALAVCVFGSHIFARLFYPAEYDMAAPLFWQANLAQIFYFATGILTTVLLRYIKEKFQVFINIAYVTFFAVVTITATKLWGLNGFAAGLLISNAFRYLFTTLVGVIELKRNAVANKTVKEE